MAVIYGTKGADTNNGTGGNDAMYGWSKSGNANSPSHNDTLNSNDGNDKLYGGTGNDFLSGGKGNDILYGGANCDTLTGGPGADIFFFSDPLEGFTTITDFQWQQGDKIQVAASGFGDSYSNFEFDRSTGKLYYMPAETAFASLQLNSGFDINLDLIIV